MNNNCPGCGKPVLEGEALTEAIEMEQKQDVERVWWHKECETVTGYIAHPVLARKKVRMWELAFEKRNPGIDLVNPFNDVEMETESHLKDSEDGDYTSVDPARLVAIDLEAVYSSDFVVAWVTGQRSYGTIMEICYAKLHGIPVYIICLDGHEDHPWLRYHATHMFTSPDQFETFMRKHNNGN